MKIGFSEISLPRSGTLVVGVLADNTLTRTAALVDEKTGGAIKRALAASRFHGKLGDWIEIMAPTGVAASRVGVVGLGKAASLDALGFEKIGSTIVRKLALSGEANITVVWDGHKGIKPSNAEAASRIGYGALLETYRFDKYRTKEPAEKKPGIKAITIGAKGARAARAAFAPLEKIAHGIFLTRNLVSEPANVIYPASLAGECRKLGKLGVKVEVLTPAAMRKLGMGALLGVAQGSANEPRLVVMRWNGGSAKAKPLVFVGKGVTFDSGGISLKPAAGMEDMKWDMGGAGTVIGLMKALAGREAAVNAIGVVALVENMPSGTAQRPGDVVRSMSGQTIEVINTDAEGRLVLADALWYAQKRFRPQLVIDLATLTGAIIISLGHEYAGLFSNDDELAERLVAAGKAEGEGVWRMPLGEAYDKDIDSTIADMRNTGVNRAGGSITAAQFLQRFIKDVPWAHLDIAGKAWGSKDKPTVPKGGTGYGVRLLDRLVADYYEQRRAAADR